MTKQVNKQQTVGLVHFPDYKGLITLKELENYAERKNMPMSDYTDRQKVNNIQWFKFDPFTGEAIHWKLIRAHYLRDECIDEMIRDKSYD